MTNIGLRELGAIVPGARRTETDAAARPATAPRRETPDPASASPLGTIFAADLPEAAEALGYDAPLNLLAELAAHARTETPLAIGLLGRSGSGKSLALLRLQRAIEALSAAARDAGSTPFLSKILTLRIDAADIDGFPAAALARALHSRLAADFPALTIEATYTARDPHIAAREAFERLDAARNKLEAERVSLGETDARRARLTESVLYEAAGSQVDAYASAHRAQIKNSLAGFGVTGDPILGFKDMVRAIADRSAAGARTSFALRAFWGLKGQTKLIVAALLLALSGLGLGMAFAEQTTWLGWMRGNEALAGAAPWFEAHMDWLLTLRQLAFAGAALALAANIWRALRLIQMVFRGEALLQADLSARRRDFDGHFGHQTRRVETLAAEVDRLSRRASEAEQRAGGLQAANPALAEPSPFSADVVKEQAQRFIAAVGALVQKSGGAIEAPQRIVIALDNLDAAPASRAREILAQVRALLGPGFVALIALDPRRIALGGGDDDARLDKWIQAPFQIGAIAANADYAALVGAILGAAKAPPPIPSPDARQSALDEPLSEAEAKLLADLAPLAGGSARAVKRFVNLYRLIRAQGPNHKGALALMLALDAGGTEAEIAAVNDAIKGPRGELAGDIHVDFQKGGARLVKALDAVQAAEGKVTVDAARRAFAAARLFSFHS
ncbi:P-loop NTPase fold protein [Methylocapsa aurea]|uniref:P-loop NTPase fold protein n=1 Tax=Methylocapsa aurea TaxID=663610 RepID=UPI00055ADE0E|nr:P-loop NTPase fold protein [Methylocapsa aurea]